MIGIRGGGEKSKVFIETPGFIVFGVNDNGTDTDDISRLKCAQQGVPEKPSPKPFPLPVQINSKSC